MESNPIENRIFELEDDGTIVHCSTAFASPAGRAVGTNFFDTPAGPFDMSELRRHFRNFVRSHKAVDRFTLKCSAGQHKFNACVSLTRAFRTVFGDPTGIVMLEIKTT